MDTIHEKDQSTKSSYSGWSKRSPRGNPSEHEGRRSHWDYGKAQDFADNTEGVAVEGKDKTHGREKGTEEDGVAVRDTKENASEQESVKDIVATEKKLWELHRLLNNRKESSSSTYKKNTEANAKVYDLNQKTMQALDALAKEYEIFKETVKKVTHETEEVDLLFAAAYEAVEEFDKAQKDQDRLQDELEFT